MLQFIIPTMKSLIKADLLYIRNKLTTCEYVWKIIISGLTKKVVNGRLKLHKQAHVMSYSTHFSLSNKETRHMLKMSRRSCKVVQKSRWKRNKDTHTCSLRLKTKANSRTIPIPLHSRPVCSPMISDTSSTQHMGILFAHARNECSAPFLKEARKGF